jgi:hypothetical protein
MMTEFLRGLTVRRGGLNHWESTSDVLREGYVPMQGGINSSYSPPKQLNTTTPLRLCVPLVAL